MPNSIQRTSRKGEKNPLFSKNFWLLCTSSLLFMMSFSMIIPELPEYLDNMGGIEYLGYVIGLFTITAGISRFWSGRFAERIGRVKVMIIGTFITALCGFLYIYTLSIFMFLALRMLHGLSTGWRPIGATAYLADISPRAKIGEAMGYLGVAGSTGMALGPALGSLIKEEVSFDAMFIASSVIGLISLILTINLPESLPGARKLKWEDLNIFKGKTLNWDAWAPSVVTLFETYSFGVVITIAPILVGHLGFKYKGLFHLTFVIASILMRMVAGKTSDKRGRLPVIAMGLSFLSVSMFVIGYSTSTWQVIVGAILYGFAIGMNRPTIFAWTADRAKKGQMALSLATMLLALEIGIGMGAFVSGELYQGNIENIPFIFSIGGWAALMTLVFILVRMRKQQRRLV